MDTLPYRQAFDRIRAEFLEMPGMRLTPEQVQRLCGVETSVCKCVLNDLVRAKFLSLSANGNYARSTDISSFRTRTPSGDARSADGHALVRPAG